MLIPSSIRISILTEPAHIMQELYIHFPRYRLISLTSPINIIIITLQFQQISNKTENDQYVLRYIQILMHLFKYNYNTYHSQKRISCLQMFTSIVRIKSDIKKCVRYLFPAIVLLLPNGSFL